MDLLFFVLIIVLFLFGASLNEAEKSKELKIIKCHEYDAAHDWTYHPETKRLTCTVCNYEAGSDDEQNK